LIFPAAGSKPFIGFANFYSLSFLRLAPSWQLLYLTERYHQWNEYRIGGRGASKDIRTRHST